MVALDRLQACAPHAESVSLVVAWFGDDLRAGHCRIRPGVEVSAKATTPENWSVNGVGRGSAHLVSRDGQNRPAYCGTSSDSAVVQAIRELKARGVPHLARHAAGDWHGLLRPLRRRRSPLL